MAQNNPLICPKCGTLAEAGQRFCAECGTVLNIDVNKPTSLASDSAYSPTMPAQPGQSAHAPGTPYPTMPPSGSQFYGATTDSNPIPPPPPAASYPSLPPASRPSLPAMQPMQSMPAQAPAPTPAPAPSPGTYVPVPDYARAPKRSRGCLLVSVVLLLVLIAGGVGAYFVFFHNKGGTSNQNNHNQTPGTGNTPTTQATNGVTPSSSPTSAPTSGLTSTPGASGVTSEQVNLAFTYSSINMTITTVEYASSFPDDPSIAQGVRVAFNESNPTSYSVVFGYNSVARLVLTDGTVIAPATALHGTPPASQASGVNWIDFALSSQPADLGQLVLVMGTASENQLKIPLRPGADLSQYQPITSSPNSTFTYNGLNWTLNKAIIAYSAVGMQATTGNIYVTLTLSAVNNTNQEFINSLSSYMRLKEGSATSPPSGPATFPISIAAQSTGGGDVTFLIPQSSTTFTLILLAQQGNPPVSQVTVDFQV